MSRKVIFCFAGCFLSAVAVADYVAMRLENDCLLKHADNDYTHGTQIEYGYADLWFFKLQQNMYAPEDITAEEHIVGDRPYCGWLGAEVGREMFKNDRSPWTHYLGVNFGMIGPSARAGEVQTLIHRWRGCREPKGWDNQLHDEFCVNLQWWTRYHWYVCDYLAIIPRAGVMAGTIQDAAEVGCEFRLGWNIRRKEVGNQMIFSAGLKKDSFWENVSAYIYAGPDCRYYLYNHILEGSLFNSKDDELAVDALPFVGEVQLGAGIDVYNFFIRYYCTFRTHEFRNQKSTPDYGGLWFGWRW